MQTDANERKRTHTESKRTQIEGKWSPTEANESQQTWKNRKKVKKSKRRRN